MPDKKPLYACDLCLGASEEAIRKCICMGQGTVFGQAEGLLVENATLTATVAALKLALKQIANIQIPLHITRDSELCLRDLAKVAYKSTNLGDDLLAQLAEARKDTKRLDWLQDDDVEGEFGFRCDDIREAIDSALESGKQEKA